MYTVRSGKLEDLGDFSYYNPEKKEIVVDDGSSFESYSRYSFVNGEKEFIGSMHGGDVEGVPFSYFKISADGESVGITDEEMDSYIKEFDNNLEKYGFTGKELNRENIDK